MLRSGTPSLLVAAPKRHINVTQRQQLTVLTVGMALFNDVLLLLMLVPMLPSLLTQGSEVGELRLALLFTVKDIFQMGCAPLAGAATLKMGARSSLGCSLFALAASTIAFAESRSYSQLIAARALQGATSAALMSGGMTLIAQTHEHERRDEAIAQAHSGLGLGAALGPVLGGLLFDSVGRRATFYVAAVLVTAAAVAHCCLSAFAPAPIIGPPPDDAPPTAQLLALIKTRDIFIVSLGIFAAFAAGGLFDTVFGLHVSEAFNFGPARASLFFSIEPICYFIAMRALSRFANHGDNGARSRARRRVSKPALVALGLALIALSLPLLPLANRQSAVVVALIVHGIGYACKDVVGYGLLADLVDHHRVGSYAMIFSLADCADSAGYIFGPIAGFALCRLVRSRSVGLLLAGIACATIAPLILTTTTAEQ